MAFCLMFVLRGFCILTLSVGGKWEHGEETEGRAEWRRTVMTWQMVDWRLSPWVETPGSQLGEGTVTRRLFVNQSNFLILHCVFDTTDDGITVYNLRTISQKALSGRLNQQFKELITAETSGTFF